MAKVPLTNVSITSIKNARNADGTAGTTSNTFSVLRDGANFGLFDTTYLDGATQLNQINKFGQFRNYPVGISFETGFNNTVRDIKIQSDGKILVVGGFTSYKGSSANYITRLNTDGSRDTSFSGVFFNDSANCLAIQSDGKILVGGNFTSYSNTSVFKIVRLNSDATIDTSFSSIFPFSNIQINTIAIQADGKIVVGGTFDIIQNVTTIGIIRLNSDGSRDTSFNMGNGFTTNGVINGIINSIVIQSDGKIIAAGLYNDYNGTSVNNIIRLNTNGTYDSTFNIGAGFNGEVFILKLQSDEKILAGGNFTFYRGASRSRLVRINTNGTNDSTFSIGSGFNANVFAINILSNSKIIVAGAFVLFDSVSTNRIVCLNSDGSRDTSFVIGNGLGGGDAFIITIKSNDKIIVGGNFTAYKSISATRIIELNTDGSRSSV